MRKKQLDELSWPTRRQVEILSILAAHRSGLGGLEVCEQSNVLYAPSIYQILRKSVGHGWISKTGHNATAVWKITPLGRKALKAYKVLHG